jgi:hypothetical protein
MIQACAKMFLARLSTVKTAEQEMAAAVIRIQCFVRLHDAKQAMRSNREANILAQNRAAVKMQATVRGKVAARNCMARNCAAISVQKIVRRRQLQARSYAVATEIDEKDTSAIVLVQSLARKRKAVQVVEARRTKASRFFRLLGECSEREEEWSRKKNASVAIQCMYRQKRSCKRAYAAKKSRRKARAKQGQKKAAVFIQKHVRRRLAINLMEERSNITETELVGTDSIFNLTREDSIKDEFDGKSAEFGFESVLKGGSSIEYVGSDVNEDGYDGDWVSEDGDFISDDEYEDDFDSIFSDVSDSILDEGPDGSGHTESSLHM